MSFISYCYRRMATAVDNFYYGKETAPFLAVVSRSDDLFDDPTLCMHRCRRCSISAALFLQCKGSATWTSFIVV